MKLPIEIIPNTRPQKFKWQQIIKAPGGDRVIKHEGTLPPSVEQAVKDLIELYNKNQISKAKLSVEFEMIKIERDELKIEIEKLRKQIEGHVDRIAAQSEIITKKVEINQPQPNKKGK